MATRIEYAHRKHQQRDEHVYASPTKKVKAAILKVIRLLSFDGGNIFKSKQWPYY